MDLVLAFHGLAAYKPSPTMRAAGKMFFKEAGYSYDPKKETRIEGRRRGARALARAEAIKRERGWWVSWQDDEESRGELCAILYSQRGTVLASLCGIDPGLNQRVIEAELALEAYSRK